MRQSLMKTESAGRRKPLRRCKTTRRRLGEEWKEDEEEEGGHGRKVEYMVGERIRGRQRGRKEEERGRGWKLRKRENLDSKRR